MTALVNPLTVDFAGDARLADLLGLLQHHDALPLVMEYDGKRTRAGYHITEIKAGSFTTLDCGGNPDRWSETILQVEDLPAQPDERPMTVGKFGAILRRVAEQIELVPDARLTVEVGPPGSPMQVLDVGSVAIANEEATLHLVPRAAICKPRHRAVRRATAAAPCCGRSNASACCG
jgi:hypothetical protein